MDDPITLRSILSHPDRAVFCLCAAVFIFLICPEIGRAIWEAFK